MEITCSSRYASLKSGVREIYLEVMGLWWILIFIDYVELLRGEGILRRGTSIKH